MGAVIRRARIPALAVLVAAPAAAYAQLFPGLPFDSRQFNIDVVDENHVRLVGEVELEGEDWEFYADEVDYYADESRLVASGNVVYVTEAARLAADRAEVNVETLTGVFYTATGSVNMGDEVERSMFGTQEPDMFFYGESIEKTGPRSYTIRKGGFTSCVQPTPRWEMTASSFSIDLNDAMLLRNMVLKVKSVPLFYLPALYYPVPDDDRATGFLMPTWGASTYRGTSLSNAFFLAMGRSHDATFYHDWFTQTGVGTGAEYRYNLGSGSEGEFETYFLNERPLPADTNGSGNGTGSGAAESFAGRRSYEMRGDARHEITENISARATIDFFSNVTVRQTYNQNLLQATNQNRTYSGNVSGSWGSYQLSSTIDANETFFGDKFATLWGGSPRVSFSQGQTTLPGTPIYFSFESEYVRLLQRDTRFGRRNDPDKITDSGLNRFDVTPVVQIPFTRWPFLAINSTVRFRSTFWSESLDEKRRQIAEGVARHYTEFETEATGPTFVKIWDTPNTGYSERMKHVIEPSISVGRLTPIENFDRIVQLEGIDSIVGNVTQVRYGIHNRLYARGGLLGDVAREIVTVSLEQSYYTDAQAAQYDRRFSTSFNQTPPSNLSPVQLTARAEPTEMISAALRAEYDTQFGALRTISADGQYEVGGWLEAIVGWSQRRFIERLRGFNDPDQLDHYINLSASMRTPGNAVGGAFQFNYDVLRGRTLQQRLIVYYNAQCCGVSFEYQSFDFQGLGSRARVPHDRRFNISFTLAGIGTFANMIGSFGSQGGL